MIHTMVHLNNREHFSQDLDVLFVKVEAEHVKDAECPADFGRITPPFSDEYQENGGSKRAFYCKAPLV